MSGVLEELVAQAEAQGATRVTLRALIEEASETGATRALERLGLTDAGAGPDIVELRALLAGWRDARKLAVRAALGWAVRTAITLILLGLAFMMGMAGRVKP